MIHNLTNLKSSGFLLTPVICLLQTEQSETGTDVVFMLDSSVDSNTFDWMKSIAKDFLLQADVDSGQWRVGGLTFDSRARPDFQLNR